MGQPAYSSSLSVSALAFALGFATVACGDDGGSQTSMTEGDGSTSNGSGTMTSAGATSASTSGTTSASTSGTTSDSATSDGPSGSGSETSTGGPGACDEEIAALAPSVTDESGGCTVVVRLDYENLDILGWNVQCGAVDGAPLDEGEARALTACCSETGNRFNPEGDETFYVFSLDPADEGGVAVVTNHLQALAFEGSVLYNADGVGEIGDILDPESFDDGEALGSGCASTDIPKTLTYDILNGGQPIPQDDVAEILDVIRTSALPAAMNEGGEVLRAVVISYPPSLPLVPGDAEYIVIVEGGPAA